jgi:hypothetical protein
MDARRWVCRAIALALGFGPLSQASAQSPSPLELPASVFVTGSPDAADTAAVAAVEAELQARQASRLQKIQQLAFDRRPSAILRAWSGPIEPAKPDAASPATPSVNPTTIATSAALTATRVVRRTATATTSTVTLPPSVGTLSGVVVAASPVATTVAVAPALATQPAQPATDDGFDAQLKTFTRMVTLGDWRTVGRILAFWPEPESKAAYKHLIQALPNPPFDQGGPGMARNAMMQQQMMMQQNPQFLEKNALTDADVIALAELAPHGREKETVLGLGGLLSLAINRGDSVEDFIALVKASRLDPRRTTALTDREAARILIAAGYPADCKVFLPDSEKAERDNDREALNMLSQHYLAIYARDKKPADLEAAWKVTQAVLAVGQVEVEQKDEALKRAVELAPKVREDLGRRWLEESFTARPDRGMEIIAAIGAGSSKGLGSMPFDPDFRQRSLELQKTAVDALLTAAPDQASSWAPSLALLASAWLAEAEFSHLYDTSTSRGPRMQRDIYGNFYYYNDFNNQNMMMRQQQNFPRPIPVARIIDAMPGEGWLKRVDEGVRPKYAAVASKLYLKVGEDTLAFPHIESLATAHPEQARELAEEFLRVWTKNHDPNAERNLRNPYIYMFGFERKAESIPLTRSKQERNLKELAGWVTRLRQLPIRQLDESLIAQAFTACHSSAEVYRLDAIESVFGSFDALKPATLAELAQQMRTNLAGLWRAPAVQEQNKTKRKEKDIRAEVLRGYQVARSVVERGMARHPEEWSLATARAALLHDENSFRQEVEPSSEFSKRRAEAFAEFQRAVGLYAKKVPQLSEDEETATPYETWFYAGLGACDLGAIDEKNQPDPRQPDLIRAAIQALPPEAATRHMNKFANDLFLRMSSLNPAVKFRYLKGAFTIVGDHEQAHEAKKVYDYYKDLVTEIKLDAIIDGPAEVGSGQPFGVFINLRHTRDIERESGGFGRYLQNQNQGNNFYYNYGRPLENYRDKFTDIVKKAMEEHFDILSVTFQDEKVNSRATSEYGWRYTPYAYLLLKARSPKVDKLPPVRLDLDFLDTSGYVIMPVETPTVPLDASRLASRPFQKLQLTETLDERQAREGKLILEVKAVGLGLVPPLEELVDVKNANFDIIKTDDQGLSVSRFDPDNEANAVVSERTVLVTMQAKEGLPARAEVFRFPAPRVETFETTYQRYVDADLAKVGPEVTLEERYGQTSLAWLWWTIGGVVALVGVTVAWRFRPRMTKAAADRFPMPDPITPFSVLGLLRDIERNNGLSEASQGELADSIRRVEVVYFAGETAQGPDLRQVAESWIGRTRV